MRRCGNTTRQIDDLIQKLFKEGSATFIDHGNTLAATRLLGSTLRDRLKYEHNQEVKIEYAGKIIAKATLIYDRRTEKRN